MPARGDRAIGTAFEAAPRGCVPAPVQLKFRAFLSYAHADVRWGKWLHGKLESYRIDKDLAGRETAMGPNLPRQGGLRWRARADPGDHCRTRPIGGPDRTLLRPRGE